MAFGESAKQMKTAAKRLGFEVAVQLRDRIEELHPEHPLAPGTYTLIVSDSVTSTASSLSLDGELSTGALPSGDGFPGGATELHFHVVPMHQPRRRLVRAHPTAPR